MVPFWRNVPDGSPIDGNPAAWKEHLLNGTPLPGYVRLVKCPIKLREQFSKADGKDVQSRKILGLEGIPVVYELSLVEPEHFLAYQKMRPLLLPVEKPTKRGDVRSLTSPIPNLHEIYYVYVCELDPKEPVGGDKMVVTVSMRPWPTPDQEKSSTAKKIDAKAALLNSVPTIDYARAAPLVPTLNGDLPPSKRPRR